LILEGEKGTFEAAAMQLWNAIYIIIPRKIAKLTVSLVLERVTVSDQLDGNPISMIENLDPRVYRSHMVLSVFLRVYFGHFLVASKSWYTRTYGADQVDGYLQLQECGSVVLILDALSDASLIPGIILLVNVKMS
jgi:hypothetical protein